MAMAVAVAAAAAAAVAVAVLRLRSATRQGRLKRKFEASRLKLRLQTLSNSIKPYQTLSNPIKPYQTLSNSIKQYKNNNTEPNNRQACPSSLVPCPYSPLSLFFRFPNPELPAAMQYVQQVKRSVVIPLVKEDRYRCIPEILDKFFCHSMGSSQTCSGIC